MVVNQGADYTTRPTALRDDADQARGRSARQNGKSPVTKTQNIRRLPPDIRTITFEINYYLCNNFPRQKDATVFAGTF
jgi:hypothetical protein